MFRFIKRHASQASLRIPSPPSSDFFYHGHSMLLHRGGGKARMTDIVAKLYEKLGSSTIHIKPLPWMNLVYTKDPTVIKTAYKYEDKYPVRPGHINATMSFLSKSVSNAPKNIFNSDGQEWKYNQTFLNKPLWFPSHLWSYVKGIDDVMDDYNALLKNLAFKNDGLIDNLPFRTYCFAMETITKIIFGQRLGLLQEKVDNYSDLKRTIDFIPEILEKMSTSWFSFPTWFHRCFMRNEWQHHKQVYKQIFDTFDKIVDEFAPTASGNSLWAILKSSNSNMDYKKVKSNMGALMFASIHSSATQLIWTFQLLAENEQVQEEVRQAINATMTHRSEVMPEDLEAIPIVRGVVKESQRLFPVVPVTVRQYDVDIEVPERGLKIPKRWIIIADKYNMGRDCNLFPDSLKFIPGRWICPNSFGTESKMLNIYYSIPFGAGRRACPGKRIAHLEMKLAVIKVLRNFRIKLVKSAEPRFAGLVFPTSLVLKFLPLN